MGNSLWVEDMERLLIEALLKRVEDRDRSANGFKKSAWAKLVAELNVACKDTFEKLITIAQAKSKEVTVSLNPHSLI